MKRKQQSGKETNNYDGHEHTQQTRDEGKLLDTCDEVRVSVKVIASAAGSTVMRVCNEQTHKQTNDRTINCFLSAPESERKPLSTRISQFFVYRFEPGSFIEISIKAKKKHFLFIYI